MPVDGGPIEIDGFRLAMDVHVGAHGARREIGDGGFRLGLRRDWIEAALDAVDDGCRFAAPHVDRLPGAGPEGQPAEAGGSPGLDDVDLAAVTLDADAEAGELAVPEHGVALDGHRRTLGQRVTARRLHGGQVAEQVGGAVLGLQEAVALVRHEPFDQRSNPPAGCASVGLLSAGSGGDRPVAGRASERRRAGRFRGKIDGMDPGDLRLAPARRRLAGDRRPGEKGIETDRCQWRFPQ